MGLTHLSFYKDQNIKASSLAKKLNIPYFRANRLTRGLVFLSVDEYKKLVYTPDMKKYLEMKRDYELHDNKRVLIEDTGLIKAIFYPRFHYVTAFNASYDIIWRAECVNKEDAVKLWGEYKLTTSHQIELKDGTIKHIYQ